jgi:hypothetical protein
MRIVRCLLALHVQSVALDVLATSMQSTMRGAMMFAFELLEGGSTAA